MSVLTLAQHMGGTLTWGSLAAPRQELRLANAELIGVLPHSPAALATKRKAFEVANTITMEKSTKRD